MKKNILTMAALLMASAAVFTACSSDDNVTGEQPANPTGKYTMTINASKGDDATTRGLYFADGEVRKNLSVNWNGKEKVRVVQDGKVIGTLSAAMSSDESTTLTGTVTGFVSNHDIGFYLLADEDGKMDYTGQKGVLLDENDTGNIEENYDFASYVLTANECMQVFTTDGSNLVAKDGTIIAFESQQAIVKFKLQKPTGTGTEWGDLFATKLIVSDKNTGKLVQSIDAKSGTKTYGHVALTPTNSTSYIYYAALNLDGTSDIMLQAFDSNGNLYTYEKSNVTFTKGSYYIVNVKMTVLTEAVDLGLSVKWATMNIGATSVTDPGKYFAWGATKPGTTFTWSNTPYYTGDGTTHSWSKYTTNESTLDATDDAAVQNWGGNWRMPTYTEWTELLNVDNCTCTWVANYNESGISGALITSKKSGYTDKSIFLPASGYYDVTTGALTSSDKAYCWIPLLYYGGENGSNALYVDFASGSYGVQNKERADGMPIRPVMPK